MRKVVKSMNTKRFIAILMIFAIMSAVCSNINMASAETGDTLFYMIEAEDGTLSGFTPVSDITAGKMRAVMSNSVNAELICNVTTAEADDSSWFVWVRAYSKDFGEKIVVSVNNKRFAIGDVYASSWKWHKISIGTTDENEFEININASSAGIYIDKLIITNNPEYKATGKVSEGLSSGSAINYYPANEAIAKYNYPEMRENNGSFYAEAEDGLLMAPMTIGEDETASGEKYIYATKGRLTEPESVMRPHCGFQFTVKEKGLYKVWIRYFTPTYTEKSTWVSIDGKNYKQFDTRITANWTWANTNSVYLAEGVHSLDIKYRQAGHRLDCFIITPDTKFSPSGQGSLPNEPIRPNVLSYAERIIPRAYVNGVEVTTSLKGKKVGDTLIIPFRNLCEKLGISFYLGDDYAVVFKGRNYLKVIENSNVAIVNGKSVPLVEPVERVKDEFMLQFDVLAKTFDIEYTIDSNNQIYCIDTSTNEVDWEQALENTEIEVYPGAMGASYSFEYPNENADIRVWYKLDGTKMWRDAFRPVYDNGKFLGSFGSLSENQKYIMKISVFEDGELKTFYKSWKGFSQESLYKTVYDFVPHEEGLHLVETYENISCYLDYTDPNSTCVTYYREKGTQEWKEAYELYNDKKIKRLSEN